MSCHVMSCHVMSWEATILKEFIILFHVCACFRELNSVFLELSVTVILWCELDFKDDNLALKPAFSF